MAGEIGVVARVHPNVDFCGYSPEVPYCLGVFHQDIFRREFALLLVGLESSFFDCVAP